MNAIYEDPTTSTILRLVSEKRNMLITGPGGTGKSTLIKKLTECHDNLNVTALTGCAALLLDCRAKTLHSWAGIGLGKDTLAKNIEHIKKKPHLKKRWTNARTLVIDEVSMLTPDLFERLDDIGRAIRKEPNRPFGGIHLILVGDFCQLPPIAKDSSGDEIETRFVFESERWDKTVTTVVLLNKIWRQKDPVYQRILSEVRMGNLSLESETILRSRMNTNWQEELIRPTLLFSRNFDVDRVNEKNLNAIVEPVHANTAQIVFDNTRWLSEGHDGPVPDKTSDIVEFAIRKLKIDAPCVEQLELRKGAQVMLLTNTDIEAGLVNGSRGIVVDFEIGSRLPIVKFKRGEPRTIEQCIWWSHEMPHVGLMQVPLRVAYAITIHKSQGASIDSAIVDIGKSTFEYGQAYVALSRVRSLEGLHVYALDPRRIKTHPRVLEFYQNLQSKVPQAMPVVQPVTEAKPPEAKPVPVVQPVTEVKVAPEAKHVPVVKPEPKNKRSTVISWDVWHVDILLKLSAEDKKKVMASYNRQFKHEDHALYKMGLFTKADMDAANQNAALSKLLSIKKNIDDMEQGALWSLHRGDEAAIDKDRWTTKTMKKFKTVDVGAVALEPVPVAPEPEPAPSAVGPWGLGIIHPSWRPLIDGLLSQDTGLALTNFVTEARTRGTVYPNSNDVFAALRLGLEDVRVVILGQDPYHGPGQAIGLSFAVGDGVAHPPSLKNIEKEVASDTGATGPVNLHSWFDQGVLLLNTILTVDAGKPLSHVGQGWEKITDAILVELASKRKGLVFMLWGKQAQKKRDLIGSGHHILECAHPSPLSAYNGFFGSKHFSKANAALGEKAIVWA